MAVPPGTAEAGTARLAPQESIAFDFKRDRHERAAQNENAKCVLKFFAAQFSAKNRLPSIPNGSFTSAQPKMKSPNAV
jgi:hypothetical protein